jgi:hypothetical protein
VCARAQLCYAKINQSQCEADIRKHGGSVLPRKKMKELGLAADVGGTDA